MRRYRPMAFAPALLALAACGSGTQHERKPLPPLSVTVASVAMREIAGSLTASGRLLPQEEVVVAADLSGFRVARVSAEEGDYVRRGQVLAMLDDSLLRSQIDQMRASLAQQQVAAEQARAQAVRVDGLDGQGVLSREAIENRRFSLRSTQAAVAATRAQLDELLVHRDHLTIRAPTDGRVLERLVRPGQSSSSGDTLFRLARGGLIDLHAELSEADLAHLSVGDPAEVTLPSGRKLAASVRLLGARVDGQTGTAIARVALPPDRELRQSGFAQARFTRGTSVLSVPEAAVNFDADGASVNVIDREGRVRRQSVRTGRRGTGLVEIIQGPPAGTRVAVRGSAFALEGDKVRIAAGSAR